jgi:S1-C subfamily serine protease
MLALTLLALLSAEPDQRKELSATMVFSRAAPSVVLVRGATDAGEVLGSRVIVARDRVVTNLHVVNGAKGLTVKLLGQELPAKLLAMSSTSRTSRCSR